MSKPDTPGVIAPPPLIYLGFLLVGWGLAELGGRPEAIEAGFGWLAAGFAVVCVAASAVAVWLVVIESSDDGPPRAAA